MDEDNTLRFTHMAKELLVYFENKKIDELTSLNVMAIVIAAISVRNPKENIPKEISKLIDELIKTMKDANASAKSQYEGKEW